MLDLMLPGRSGMEILTAVRRALPSLPVIVLTARGEIEDRVEGLEAGAVDYLVKPFSMAELVARVRAQLRVVAQASTSALAAEGIEVDLLSRKVRRGGDPVPLSTTEFELLVYLLRHRGEVVSREQILSSVWGYEHDPATNVVDVYVGYLRRKLPDSPRRSTRYALSATAWAAPAEALGRALNRLRPAGLHWRLAGWFTIVTVACTAIIFVAVYRGTGTQLRHQIDGETTGDARELAHNLLLAKARTPRALAAAADRYIQAQPFRASSTLLFAVVPGAARARTVRSCLSSSLPTAVSLHLSSGRRTVYQPVCSPPRAATRRLRSQTWAICACSSASCTCRVR